LSELQRQYAARADAQDFSHSRDHDAFHVTRCFSSMAANPYLVRSLQTKYKKI